MPELPVPDLDEELLRARTDLLRDISLPELAGVRNRAHRLRRRRHLGQAGAAVLTCLALLGVGSMVPRGPLTTGPEPGAQTTPVTASSWRGGGLTLLGLTDEVLDLPGEVRDVDFFNRDVGYAMATQCSELCHLRVAQTMDGGRTWRELFANEPMESAEVPDLIALESGAVLAGSTSWSAVSRSDFIRVQLDPSATVSTVPAGGRLWVDPSPTTCTGSPLYVWRADGSRAELTTAPQMSVCRVAPAPAADGTWWVSGTADGAPAVAFSRNRGASWSIEPLGPTGGWAQVATLGSDVYASVVSLRGGEPNPQTLTVHAVYRSREGGFFREYADMIGTAVGEVVPLLDGRLVAAEPNWYVSSGPGGRLEPAGGSMPWVGRIERTPAGWVAYDLLDADWTAISSDGATWQKINIR